MEGKNGMAEEKYKDGEEIRDYSRINAKKALSTFAVAAICGNWLKRGQSE